MPKLTTIDLIISSTHFQTVRNRYHIIAFGVPKQLSRNTSQSDVKRYFWSDYIATKAQHFFFLLCLNKMSLFDKILCNYPMSTQCILENLWGSLGRNMQANFLSRLHPCLSNYPAFLLIYHIYNWWWFLFCHKCNQFLTPTLFDCAELSTTSLALFLLLCDVLQR